MSAIWHEPLQMLRQAMSMATSEVEQAVCRVSAGPRRPREWATRVAAKSLSLSCLPTMAASAWSGNRVSVSASQGMLLVAPRNRPMDWPRPSAE